MGCSLGSKMLLKDGKFNFLHLFIHKLVGMRVLLTDKNQEIAFDVKIVYCVGD